MEHGSHCRGCIYCAIVGGMASCDYLFQVGTPRPCPPGKDCTVRITVRQEPKPKLRGTVRSCEWCGTEFELSGNVTKKFCSKRCKDAAFRMKQRQGKGDAHG